MRCQRYGTDDSRWIMLTHHNIARPPTRINFSCCQCHCHWSFKQIFRFLDDELLCVITLPIPIPSFCSLSGLGLGWLRLEAVTGWYSFWLRRLCLRICCSNFRLFIQQQILTKHVQNVKKRWNIFNRINSNVLPPLSKFQLRFSPLIQAVSVCLYVEVLLTNPWWMLTKTEAVLL